MSQPAHHFAVDSPHDQTRGIGEALSAGERFTFEGRTIVIPDAYISEAEASRETQIDHVRVWAAVAAHRIMNRSGPYGPQLADSATTYYVVECPSDLPLAYAGRYSPLRYGYRPGKPGSGGKALLTHEDFMALREFSTDLYAERRSFNPALGAQEVAVRDQIAQHVQPLEYTAFADGFVVDLGRDGEVMINGLPDYQITVECAANAVVS